MEGSSVRKLLLVPVVALVAVAGAVAPFAGATIARPAANVVTITASKTGLKYTQKTVRAKAGKVTLVFKNPSMLQHNVRLEIGEKEFGGTKKVTHGSTSVVVNLKKGTYHFYCSVPGTKTPACPARSSFRSPAVPRRARDAQGSQNFWPSSVGGAARAEVLSDSWSTRPGRPPPAPPVPRPAPQDGSGRTAS